MNKKTKIVIVILAVVLVVFLAIMGKNYYQRRYVGTTYYGKVAADQSVEPINLRRSGDGKEIGRGMEYRIIAFDEKGNEQLAIFDRYTENSEDLLQPNSYVKFSLSEEIVLKHEKADRADVPESILAKLDQ